MQKNRNFFYSFFTFLLISVFIFILGKTGLLNFIKNPFESLFSFHKTYYSNYNSSKIENENRDLLKSLADKKTLEKDDKALKDQFQTAFPKSLDLIPASVVGAPRFIPGISIPDTFILNRGERDNVKAGMAVVFQNNLVGKIVKTTSHLSQANLLTNTDISFTAKTASKEKNIKGAMGVIKVGEGNQIVLSNVLLSDDIKKSDLVLTNGDLNVEGLGIPPDLIVGRIISVEKKPSALFQNAQVKSLIDFSKLSTVFIVSGIK